MRKQYLYFLFILYKKLFFSKKWTIPNLLKIILFLLYSFSFLVIIFKIQNYCVGQYSTADVIEKCGGKKRTIKSHVSFLYCLGFMGLAYFFLRFVCKRTFYYHSLSLRVVVNCLPEVGQMFDSIFLYVENYTYLHANALCTCLICSFIFSKVH